MSDEHQVEQWKDHLKQGPTKVKAIGNFITERYDWVDVERGLTDEGDYVWHFTTHHAQRVFPKDMTLIRSIIITYLDKNMPDNVKVDYYPSPTDWEKKVESVKAREIGKLWIFDEDHLNQYLPKLCELLNQEILKYAQQTRRTRL